MIVAFVGIGSNLDGPARRVTAAFDALDAIPATRVTGRSPLYGSAPMGPPDQPPYVNAVARLETGLDPRALLAELQCIEQRAGRARDGERWGPRTLDLDLLLCGDAVIDEEGLTVPHPGIADRAFVLVPLAAIDPECEIPGRGKVDTLLHRVDRGTVWLLEEAGA